MTCCSHARYFCLKHLSIPDYFEKYYICSKHHIVFIVSLLNTGEIAAVIGMSLASPPEKRIWVGRMDLNMDYGTNFNI